MAGAGAAGSAGAAAWAKEGWEERRKRQRERQEAVDAAEALIDHTYKNCLQAEPGDHPLLMAEASHNTPAAREKMAELMGDPRDPDTTDDAPTAADDAPAPVPETAPRTAFELFKVDATRESSGCRGDGVRVRITDTQKKAGDLYVHLGTVEQGTVQLGVPTFERVTPGHPHTFRVLLSATNVSAFFSLEALSGRPSLHVANVPGGASAERQRSHTSHWRTRRAALRSASSIAAASAAIQ